MDQTAAACEIERLPEDLLVHVISLTSPRDAFRAAIVSQAFHAAADSDTVWSSFLPRDLPRFAKNELTRTPPATKKGLFRRLSDQPVLLPHKLVRMQLDKATGAKCFTLSAKALQIGQFRLFCVGIDFGYSESRGKSFLQASRVFFSPGLEIRAKLEHKMLSLNTTYVAYMVFKLIKNFYGYGSDSPFQMEAMFGVAGSESMRKVCLQGYVEEGDGTDESTRKHILQDGTCYLQDDVVFPRKMADGWMEVELGEFHNKEGDGEVSISLIMTAPGQRYLNVWGIELRCKQQRPAGL